MSGLKSSPAVERPWGRFTIVSAGTGFQVKLLTVDAGQALSLQFHQRRTEYWMVLAGRGHATVDGAERVVKPGDRLTVEAGAKHRLSNDGTSPLEIVEVQFGDYLGEDDIVRLEDRYGRT